MADALLSISDNKYVVILLINIMLLLVGCVMDLTPAEALNAVTMNGAYAMGVSDITGSITRGKRADFILTQPGWTLTKLPYLHHTPYIRSVYLEGKAI